MADGGGGREWDPRLSGAAVEAATENKCFRPVKTPDFGIVVSMILNYMQRARVPVYTPITYNSCYL